jgi:probable FeS assembly SUF system protein SufT
MVNEEVKLLRDCDAIIIPAGDTIRLEAGTSVLVTQALGGTLTVRSNLGLFRIAAKDFDALGDGVKDVLAEETSQEDDNAEFSQEKVWDRLKQCFDPEIPINIVDLGLVYDMSNQEDEDGQYSVSVLMTLTAQGCGMGPSIAADAKAKIESLAKVKSAQVDIVWDPVWNPQMISEEGRKALGIT